MLYSVSYSDPGNQNIISRFVPGSSRAGTSRGNQWAYCIDATGHTELDGMHAFDDEQYMIADHDHHIVIRQMSVPAGKRAYRRTHPQGKLLAIADGMAGIGGSDVAAMAAMDGVLHYITSAMPWILTGVDEDDQDEGPGGTDRVLDNLKHVLVRCEHRLRRVVEGRGVQGPLASAITLAYVMWPDLYVVHAGGSRCHIFRNNHIYCIDSDHALEQPAGSAAGHGSGATPTIEVANPGDSMATQTGAHHVTLAAGDSILLCTSSVTRYLGVAELTQYLNGELSADTMRDRLIAATKDAGSTENITIVTCRCE